MFTKVRHELAAAVESASERESEAKGAAVVAAASSASFSSFVASLRLDGGEPHPFAPVVKTLLLLPFLLQLRLLLR